MSTKGTATVRTDESSLTIDRTFATTPERLFEAWTNPELTARWLAPGPMHCKLPVYDAREGGRFRIEMTGTGPDGEEVTYVYEGTFDAVVPGERIVMTWRVLEDGPGEDDPPSVVTATFTPVEGGTRMRLTQDAFPNEEYAEGAAGGWQSAFDKLADSL